MPQVYYYSWFYLSFLFLLVFFFFLVWLYFMKNYPMILNKFSLNTNKKTLNWWK